MAYSTMAGRPKRAAIRRSYKIDHERLADLSATARLAFRSDTSQLEAFIAEGAKTWLEQNPDQAEEWQAIRDELLAEFIKKVDEDN